MPSLPRSEEESEKIPFIKLLDSIMDRDMTTVHGQDDGQTKEWPSLDYRTIPGAWVLREKHFGIYTFYGSGSVVCIAEIAPDQYDIYTTQGNIEVRYVLDVINSRSFNPVHFVGTLNGNEYICTDSGIPYDTNLLPQSLRELDDMGSFELRTAQETGEDDWINLLRHILTEETFEPLRFRMTEKALEDYLHECNSLDDPNDERTKLHAENHDTQQRLLGYYPGVIRIDFQST